MTTNEHTSVLDEAARTIGALLWALYRHQGSNDAIEQGAREMLGIGPSDPMTDAQVAAAKRFEESIAHQPAAVEPLKIPPENMTPERLEQVKRAFVEANKMPGFLESPTPMEAVQAKSEGGQFDDGCTTLCALCVPSLIQPTRTMRP